MQIALSERWSALREDYLLGNRAEKPSRNTVGSQKHHKKIVTGI